MWNREAQKCEAKNTFSTYSPHKYQTIAKIQHILVSAFDGTSPDLRLLVFLFVCARCALAFYRGLFNF